MEKPEEPRQFNLKKDLVPHEFDGGEGYPVMDYRAIAAAYFTGLAERDETERKPQ